MNYYVNKNIAQILRIFPDQGRYKYYRYDMNENPEGLPKEFVDSVLREITPEFLATYPEPDRFLYKYADFIGVKYHNLLATNGSDMAIRYIFETFGEPGKEVVTVSPTFEMYRVNCSLLGLQHIPVSYEDDLTISVDKIIDAISENTRIVVLLNPNNPIGNIYTEEEIKKVAACAKKMGAILIVDEAYYYSYDKTFVKYISEYDNIIVLRTFSKLLSIAAARVGVIISHPQIIHYVKNARLTFDTNALGLLFAERLLEHRDLIDELIRIEKEGKEYTLNALRKHHYWCRDCKGNFIFIASNHDPQIIAKRLKEEKKILVHTHNNELLKQYLRVSVGSKQAMQIFLDAFLELDAT